MEQVYLISADRLKEDTVVSENTDNKLINPTILMVQDIYIQALLGTDLFEEIKAEIKNSALTETNKNLLDNYLHPALKYYCMAELCTPLTYKFMNKAILVKQGDNSTPVTFPQLTQIQQYYMNRAEWYAKRVVKFLQENHLLYPLWQSGNTTLDSIKPKRNTYYTGMYLGNTRKNSSFITSLFPGEELNN